MKLLERFVNCGYNFLTQNQFEINTNNENYFQVTFDDEIELEVQIVVVKRSVEFYKCNYVIRDLEKDIILIANNQVSFNEDYYVSFFCDYISDHFENKGLERLRDESF